MAEDHGAAGFCAGCTQPAPDERVETVARAHVVVAGFGQNPWACRCGADFRTSLQYARHFVATVVAALDDDSARLRAKAWDEGAFEGLRTPRGFSWTLVNNPYRAALDPEEPR